ncbi:host nuclease inhibitor GamL, partial [Enterobacter hormaechei]
MRAGSAHPNFRSSAMNAFLTYDRIEDRCWVEQQLTDEKEKWI